ncbi:MAG: hypothetical protein M3N39_10430, partial [Pseudomonadota bacterium]|nr:hypothetical protein [Pseudomonadota bacterium]
PQCSSHIDWVHWTMWVRTALTARLTYRFVRQTVPARDGGGTGGDKAEKPTSRRFAAHAPSPG